MVDLDYGEDSIAQVDANFVITKKSGFSEVQASGEQSTFTSETLMKMINHVDLISKNIFSLQENVLK